MWGRRAGVHPRGSIGLPSLQVYRSRTSRGADGPLVDVSSTNRLYTELAVRLTVVLYMDGLLTLSGIDAVGVIKP